MILQPVLKPVILGLEPDQDSRRPSMTRDQDLLLRSKPKVARKVILHLCQGHSARLG